MAAETPETCPPRRNRRWFQFRLRTLMLAVTAVAIVCGLFVSPAMRQRRIVHEINANGGQVYYDHEPQFFLARWPEENWFDRTFGFDFRHTATGVRPGYESSNGNLRRATELPHLESIDLSNSDVHDSDLSEISGLSGLKELDINLLGFEFSMGILHQAEQRDPHLTPASMRYLDGLTKMEKLSLESRSCMTDDQMKYLAKMTSLRVLDLRGTSVTAVGLAQLKCQPTLQELDVWACRDIDDAAMNLISDFKSLRALRIGLSKVTDKGLAKIEGLQSLEELDLQECPITDAGLAHVGKLRALRRLSLYETEVSDEGLALLEPIGELDEINLNDTKVTRQGVEAAAKHLVVRQWAIPQEWRDEVRVPAGQGIYGTKPK
jgi:hypothetical protein